MKHLPEYITNTIQNELENNKLSTILKNRRDMTENYHSDKVKQLASEKDALVYLLTRAPNIYFTISSILENLSDTLFQEEIRSILDLGAGVGTATYALLEYLEKVEKITFLEKNKYMNLLSKKIRSNSALNNLKNLHLIEKDIKDSYLELNNHDITIISYTINELGKDYLDSFIKTIWKKTNKFLIIFEPGSKQGFSNIKGIRELLIKEKANIIAPCTHKNLCPMNEPDWCHFSKRIERTSYQRFLKEGTDSFEDEKFSYLIASKLAVKEENSARVLRNPTSNKVGVELKLCSNNKEIEYFTVNKKAENYKLVKKLAWGDKFNKQ